MRWDEGRARNSVRLWRFPGSRLLPMLPAWGFTWTKPLLDRDWRGALALALSDTPKARDDVEIPFWGEASRVGLISRGRSRVIEVGVSKTLNEILVATTGLLFRERGGQALLPCAVDTLDGRE